MSIASPAVKPPARPPLPTRLFDPFAGLLSYLIPGMGQIYQGRVGKGVLFLVCIYTLFFYGQYLGSGSVKIGLRTYSLNGNVYLPDTAQDHGEGANPFGLPPLALNLYNRPQFVGQFWVGVAAWPAILQYLSYDRRANQELDREIDQFYSSAENEQETDPDKAREDLHEAENLENSPKRRHPILGRFQREPSPSAVNAVGNAGDKRLELAWVYTVIAGVLNIMVIYDAIAGPAFLGLSRVPAGLQEQVPGPAREGA
jgi:hypothetical protein